MKEEWKKINGPEGSYYISNYGRLKGPRCVRAPQYDRAGYIITVIQKQNYKIHRLVGLAFVENTNPDLYNQINHLDGDKTNNHYTNLEWTDSHNNHLHAYKLGLMVAKKGSDNFNAKLTVSDVIRIRQLKKLGLSNRVIGDMFSVSAPTICLIVNYKSWAHISEYDN